MPYSAERARMSGNAVIGEARRAVAVGVGGLAVLSLLINLGALAGPLFGMAVFNRVLTTRNPQTLIQLAIGLALALLFTAALEQCRGRALAILADRFTRRLSRPLMEASLGRGPAAPSQSLRDLETLRQFLGSTVCLAPFDLMWTPVLLLVFLALHWAYALLALVSCAALTALNLLGDMIARRRLVEAQHESARAYAIVGTAMRGAEAVIAMGMLPALASRWAAGEGAGRALAHRAALRSRAIAAATKAARMAMTGAMVALGLILALAGLSSGGAMVAGNMMLAKLLAPFEQIASTGKLWSGAVAAWQRIVETLRTEAPGRYTEPLPRPEGDLVVDRVVHIPQGSDRPALRGISFTLAPREVLGIIGPSGAGKSTLLRLILGMEAPGAGGIYLDGHATALWQREDFARHVGYVPQALALTSGTIAETIARLATPDHGAVLDAAQRAGVHAAIMALPHGYATPITAGGFTLSGGQRQRLAIARALYGNPRLLVLDEPNAALDAAGEADLAKTIKALKEEGVGTILVTQRPSLVGCVDTLMVLKGGTIERYGPRESVLRDMRAPAIRVVRRESA